MALRPRGRSRLARETLSWPADRPPPDTHDPVGFAIAHDGADGGFALFDWFANGNEIDHESPAIGCVGRPRPATRHVLERGDLEAHVADTFEADV